MKEMTPPQMICYEEDLNFERERLLNLIDSKIRRNEMGLAKDFAEELFQTEIVFALFKKTERLKKCNSLLVKVMLSMIGALLLSITCMVLNINPVFNLLAQVCTILVIITAVIINSLLVKRFGRAIKMMVDVYETVRQSFIDRLLDSFLTHSSPHMTLKMLSLTVVK